MAYIFTSILGTPSRRKKKIEFKCFRIKLFRMKLPDLELLSLL